MSETGASSAFEDAFHKAAERHERAWVFLAVTMLTLLLAGTMFLVVYAYGIVVRTDGFRRDPAALDTPEGSVVKTGPNAYTVTVVAHLWRWSPSPLRIPKGATVTFRVTSADVLHGFAIQGTTVNVTAVPGITGSVTYTFNRPGTFNIVCNEYCGLEHQGMLGRIVVTGDPA